MRFKRLSEHMDVYQREQIIKTLLSGTEGQIKMITENFSSLFSEDMRPPERARVIIRAL